MNQEKTATQLAIDMIGKSQVAQLIGVVPSYVTRLYLQHGACTRERDIDLIVGECRRLGWPASKRKLMADMKRLAEDRREAADRRADSQRLRRVASSVG